MTVPAFDATLLRQNMAAVIVLNTSVTYLPLDINLYGAVAQARNAQVSGSDASNQLGYAHKLVEYLAKQLGLSTEHVMLKLYATVIIAFKGDDARRAIENGDAGSGIEPGSEPPTTAAAYLYVNCHPGFIEYSLCRTDTGDLVIEVVTIDGNYHRTPVMTVTGAQGNCVVETPSTEPPVLVDDRTVEECAFLLTHSLADQIALAAAAAA